MNLPASFCPYIGLQPYNEEYMDYFYGRERDQRVISSNLLAARLTILYGASGVGKSSVLMAGVVPLLMKKPRIVVVVFRDWHGNDFLSQIKSECIKSIGTIYQAPLDLDRELPLDELLYKAGKQSRTTILIILDQFEEYFLYHAGDTEIASTFEKELACAVNNTEIDANFLITLREDGLSKLDRFRTRIPNLMGNLLRLKHLDLSSAEEAIRKPLEVYKKSVASPQTPVGIEDELVQAILGQVQSGRVSMSSSAGVGEVLAGEGRVRIETPFLQLVMTRLWDEEVQAGSEVLRLKTLADLGGAQNIVCRHLDAVMEKLESPDQELCAGFFDRLVTPSGTKIACRLDDLTNWAGDRKDRVHSVVKALDDKRLLRSIAAPADQLGAPSSYEIFHDVLAPAVLDWRRRFVAKQMEVRIRQEEEEKRIKEQEEAALQQELERQKRIKEQENAAHQQEVERARRLRRTVFVLSLFVVILILVASYAYHQRNEAKQLAEKVQISLGEMRKSIKLVEAAMSDNPFKEIEKLASHDSTLLNKKIKFKVTYKDLGYRTIDGKEVCRFKIFPDSSSIPGGLKVLASITYRTPHKSFKNQMYKTGPESSFTATYDGWGVIDVIAIIEYANPDEAPSLAIVDMQRELVRED